MEHSRGYRVVDRIAELRFKSEAWAAVEPEIREIVPEHWQGLAVFKDQIPLEPNWDFYRTAEGLHIVTARTPSGSLAGYYISLIFPHPHYKSTLFNFLDSYYIKPEYRNARTGMLFFNAVEAEMRARHVRCMIATTKAHLDVGPVFERLGWMLVGKTYSKLL